MQGVLTMFSQTWYNTIKGYCSLFYKAIYSCTIKLKVTLHNSLELLAKILDPNPHTEERVPLENKLVFIEYLYWV